MALLAYFLEVMLTLCDRVESKLMNTLELKSFCSNYNYIFKFLQLWSRTIFKVTVTRIK